MFNGDEDRRGGEVAVPKVVPNGLEMPDALARFGFEGEQAIGEEVVANAVASVEIEGGGTGGNVQNAGVGIERHARPIVGGAAGLPRVLRPSFIAVLAGMRNGVKGPARLSGAHVEGTDVPRSGRKCLRFAASHDEKVFVNHRWAGKSNEERGCVSSQAFAEIDSALIAECSNWLAGIGIQLVNEVHDASDDAAIVTGLPIGKAAIGLGALNAGIEFPFELSGGGVYGKDLLRGRDSVQNTVHHDGTGLQAASFLGVEGPRDLELLHVVAINLLEFGVVAAFGGPAVNRPVAIAGTCDLQRE